MSMLLKNSFLKQSQQIKVWLAFLICTLLMTSPALLLAQSGNPVLDIANQVSALPNSQVSLPIQFTANGNQINSIAFSIDYDESWLSFDNTDGNSDGIPDAMSLSLPAGYSPMVSFDASDTDGEIDIAIFTLSPSPLPDGQIGAITLGVGNPPSQTEAAVAFSSEPVASFGNTSGQSVDGTADGGSVLIVDDDEVGACVPPPGQNICVDVQGQLFVELADIIFPNFILDGEDGTISVDNILGTVSDRDDADTPWDVTLSATGPLSDGDNIIPIGGLDDLIVECLSVDTTNGDANPTCEPIDFIRLSSSGDITTVVSADPGTGNGTYPFTLGFELQIPGETLPGSYSTTINTDVLIGTTR